MLITICGLLSGVLAIAALIMLDNGAPKAVIDGTVVAAFFLMLPLFITRLREIYRESR